MRRFLVVGCGGSGGSTLAYLMDQLRSDLAAEGVDSLPHGWQFVVIDVPTSPDGVPDGLANVERQGGTYIGTGPQSGSYTTLDRALSQQLAGTEGLEAIGTWAPRVPPEVTTPISVGAGQYRAVGRMITLSKVREVTSRLQQAWDELFKVETTTQMARLAEKIPSMGAFEPNDKPIVLVVSSMAGGAGASMALDVCRMLTLVSGLDPRLMGVFMVSADVFDTLPEASRSGVRPNALAMLGEIVASQTGAARRHDVALLRSLGQYNGEGAWVPFARVFPVGRFVGAQRTLFGDGTPKAVYRGLGRGLSALMMSGVATDPFVAYDLGNTGSTAGNANMLGWGAEWNPLPWGSFGFASLSMGRDRYAEYAAQRLARSSADRLLSGHLQANNTASGSEQVNALLDSQWAQTCVALQVPGPVAQPADAATVLSQWYTKVAFPLEQVNEAVRALAERELVPYIPSADGLQAAQWIPGLRRQLAVRRAVLTSAANETAYRWAFDWHQKLLERTMSVVAEAVARFGVPYAMALVARLEQHLGDAVMPGLRALGGLAPADPLALPAELEGAIGGLRGVIANGQTILTRIADAIRDQLRRQVFAHGAAVAEQVLGTYVVDVLGPLSDSLAEAQRLLEQSQKRVDRDLGLARLATDHYAAWPCDQDVRVPARFGEANNEVLLTSSADFAPQYEADVRAAVSDKGGATGQFAEARERVLTQVVSGAWETTGGTRPPGGLLELTATWRSRVFGVDPETGESLVPSLARFDLHARPGELLARSRQFVARPNESFETFCGVSLRAFVTGKGAVESEREGRVREVVAKFRETLSLAMPLVSADADAVRALHSRQLEYRYKFSATPFKSLPLEAELLAVLTTNPSIDTSSFGNLTSALTAGDNVKKIDVFGSYPNYSPLVFDSVLRPPAQQWSETMAGGRDEFWKWRRARPLDAALPMSDAERRAMVAGWYIGQIVGDLRIPDSPFTRPVEVWDVAEGRWSPFPNPLLTPPARFTASYDWLPAVLESVLIAIARCHEQPVMSSLLPYQALRALYDATEDAPNQGILELSARQLLVDWLLSGKATSGGRSRVTGIDGATTPAARAAAATGWLAQPAELASVHFMPPNQDGTAGGGSFSVITSRSQAAQAPIFRDLAPDIWWATQEVTRLLADALSVAEGRSAEPPIEGISHTESGAVRVPLPKGGVF